MSVGAVFGLPVPDHDSEPWWRATGEHRLLLQRCDACPAYRWPARAMCNRCGSLDWSWVEASGRASVVSWMVNHHSFVAGAPPVYTVVLGRLEEQSDVLIPATWGGAADGSDLAVGQPLVVDYDEIDGAIDESATPMALLRWMPRTPSPDDPAGLP
jgi:uncharacterized OB-fold protein